MRPLGWTHWGGPPDVGFSGLVAAGEAIDAPYGALVDLARDTGSCDAADRIRSWCT
jgi:hypothetical protein